MSKETMLAKVAERWNSRIVVNNWNEMGAKGAEAYLAKFGKGIGNQKLQAFADYAYELGLKEFGDEMIRNIK
jgi:hypothetical protein